MADPQSIPIATDTAAYRLWVAAHQARQDLARGSPRYAIHWLQAAGSLAIGFNPDAPLLAATAAAMSAMADELARRKPDLPSITAELTEIEARFAWAKPHVGGGRQ